MKFTRKYKNSLWFKGWEKVSQANRTENHADIVILISDKQISKQNYCVEMAKLISC